MCVLKLACTLKLSTKVTPSIAISTISYTLYTMSHNSIASRSSNNSAPHSSNASPHSSNISDVGCAVRADGSLKDASEIQFFHDKDNDLPMAIGSPSASEDSATEASNAKEKAPTKVRTSTRKTKPSQRVREAAESEPPKKSTLVASSEEVPEDTEDTEKELSDDTEKELSGPNNSDLTYEKLKQMGDNDNSASLPHNKEELTADIHLIFRHDKTYRNPNTNKVLDSHWLKNLLVTQSASLLEAPALYVHILQEEYIEHCKTVGIEPNACALSKLSSAASEGMMQTTLDTTIKQVPKPPAYSRSGLFDHIIEMIICEDEAFQLIKRGSF
ncbi:hypothetical protein BDQ17DRAFT_1420914 [Cyathus striatus]|nr:hypothetical protein BDQ17DRAFT_1420914 [Cyathus striatus]